MSSGVNFEAFPVPGIYATTDVQKSVSALSDSAVIINQIITNNCTDPYSLKKLQSNITHIKHALTNSEIDNSLIGSDRDFVLSAVITGESYIEQNS